MTSPNLYFNQNYETFPQKKNYTQNLNFEIRVEGRDQDESRLPCVDGWRMDSPIDRDNVQEMAEKKISFRITCKA